MKLLETYFKEIEDRKSQVGKLREYDYVPFYIMREDALDGEVKVKLKTNSRHIFLQEVVLAKR